MEESASTLEIILTWGSLVLVIIGAAALQVWAGRRRRRGDEGDTSDALGAEAIAHQPPQSL